MKRFISLVVVMALFFTGFTVVFADDKAEVLALSVKQKLQIPDEYTNLVTSKTQTKNTETLTFRWEREDGEYIRAVSTYDGIITAYTNSKVKNRLGISKYSSKEAADIANEWMKTVNSVIASEYIFEAEGAQMQYGITLSTDRKVGEVPVEDNSAYIEMSGQTGEIAYFYLNYTPYEFENYDDILTKESAQEIFGEDTHLMLVYIKTADNSLLPIWTDVKGLYEDDYGIDAISGEIVDYTKKLYNNDMAAGSSKNDSLVKDEAADEYRLTEAEISELSKYDKCITKEDAVKIIENIEELGVKNYEIVSVSYAERCKGKIGESTKTEIILNMSMKKGESRVSLLLNGKTGEFLSFYSYEKSESETEKNKENSEAVAESFMEKAAKNRKYTKVAATDNLFVYYEEVNGIPFKNSEARVTVNKESGFIESFYAEWENGEEYTFKEAEIEEAEAGEIYTQKSECYLIYTDISGSLTMPVQKNAQIDDSAPFYKLLYRRAHNVEAVNAVNGKVCDLNGEEYKEQYRGFSDLDGHWAKDAVCLLVENGFIKADEEKFRPEDNITEEEAVKMMRGAFLYANYGQKESKESITREECAKMIVCGAGCEKAGRLSDIYRPVFNDWENVGDEFSGYVALAKGLGFVNGDLNGNFNPKSYVTRGAFAVMIYNYLASGNMEY